VNEEQLHWLLRCADRLNAAVQPPIDIEGIVRQWRIELRRETRTDAGCEGTTSRTVDGRYLITLFPHRAKHRERFTLAHELGHVLIEEKFGWTPTNDREYYQREEWCNKFAARLLVPDAPLQKCRMDSITLAIRSVLWLARTCFVSREVAARRLTEYSPQFGLAELEERRHSDGTKKVHVRWATPEMPERGLRRRRLLDGTNPITEAVCSGSVDQRFVDVLWKSDRAMACRSKLVPSRHLLWYASETKNSMYGVQMPEVNS
jgi:hypothetical protein